VNSKPDPTFAMGRTNDATLENFFSRPIRIHGYSWAPGTSFFETFNPWEDYFNNARVKNRIANFNLLNCRLCVKILLNGNTFYYGRALVSYWPLPGHDSFTGARALIKQDMILASQRPHAFLDPTESQGATFQLPFVYTRNAVSIPFGAWDEMGVMDIHNLTTLKHATGSTAPITVSVFAWAEDVQLSVLTSLEPTGMTPQSGGDEYGDGIVSKPAAVVAGMAGKLSSVPTIAPYAMATQMVANAVSSLALAFGFSRPTSVTPSTMVTPQIMGNMANSNIGDTCVKLTYDAKQELTIDSRTCGLAGDDEMTISSIAQRETYITTFQWPISANAEDFLWVTDVTPVIWDTVDIGGNTELHMPACCFAALPFQYWKGTMRYRFQIVASGFHKGRLKFSYDPNIMDTNEYNTNYTYIVDLSSNHDLTIDVGWGQVSSMVPSLDPNQDLPPFSDLINLTLGQGYSNGVLAVHVVNELTSPSSTTNNDISINVFVSAGPDFEVFDPIDRKVAQLSWFAPQATFTPQSDEGDNAPVQESSTELMSTEVPGPNLNAVYFGDPIVSFRQCLKRYNLHSISVPEQQGSQWVTLRIPNFPYHKGFAPTGVTPVAGDTFYNYSKMTLLNYLTPAYVCWRGGIRWKYLLTQNATSSNTHMAVTRTPTYAGAYELDEVPIEPMTSSQGTRTKEALRRFGTGHPGTHWSSVQQNPVIEVELPFHRNARFAYAKRGDYLQTTGTNEFHRLSTTWDAGSDSTPHIFAHVATGEDFNLSFFTGCPIGYRDVSTVAPT